VTEYSWPARRSRPDTNKDLGERINRADVEQQRRHDAHRREGHDQSASYANCCEKDSLHDKHADQFGLLRAESNANADLARSLRHRIGNHAV
jgi:hypothetical protein